MTATGVLLSIVEPLPSAPDWFHPQQMTPPAVVTAHEWRIARANVDGTGINKKFIAGASLPLEVAIGP